MRQVPNHIAILLKIIFPSNISWISERHFKTKTVLHLPLDSIKNTTEISTQTGIYIIIAVIHEIIN